MTSVMKSDGQAYSSQIVFKQHSRLAPRYKMLRVNLSNLNTNQMTLSATNTTQLSFKLPYNVAFNLSKSRFAGSLAVLAQTNAFTSGAIADAWPFFGSVSLETGNGIQLVNLTDPTKYSKVVGQTGMDYKEYLTRDTSDLIAPSNSATNATQTGVAQSVAYLEPLHLDESTANNAKTITYNLGLGDFKNTILGLDKDLYFGQNDIYLKITIGNYDKWIYETTTDVTLPVALAANSFSSVYLYLAVEQNPVITDALRDKFDSTGIQLLIDYPITTRVSSAAGTSQSIIVPYQPSMGKTLKKVVYTCWHATENLGTSVDNDNTAGAKIATYNTYVDAQKLQDDVVTCSTVDPWRLNEAVCRGTPVINRAVYMKNFFHQDTFENVDMAKESKTAETAVDGLKMDKGLQWQLSGTSANAAFIHLVFGIFQREILINRDGVQFV